VELPRYRYVAAPQGLPKICIIPGDQDRDCESSQRKEGFRSYQDDYRGSCTHRSFALSIRVNEFSVRSRLWLDVCPYFSLVLPSLAILNGPTNHSETYGPVTRNYPQPSWDTLPSSDRAKLAARQGHAFATSFPLRVIHPTNAPGEALVDVPRDGKTVGEIVVRGNIVMQGYFQDPDATARTFDGGYFHSGDLAVWHPDGSVQIQDRMKDIIISGGEVGTVHTVSASCRGS
jgi:AMP-binding enzyme